VIDGIIAWSLKNRMLVIAGAVVLLVWGAYQSLKMPVDVFPDLTAPTVTVLTEAHGLAPEDVETQISFPIETTLNGAHGVRRVRSSSGVGISIVWVELDWGTDPLRARQIVSEKLQLVQGRLPPEIEPPIMAPITSIMGEIMFIALTSDSHHPRELKTVAEWNLRPRLLAIPGVSQVISIGGDTKQYQVAVDPDRLARYGIGLDRVVAAVRRANENTSAGFYHEGGREYLIQGFGRIESIEDLGATLIEYRDEVPVTLGDLATIEIGNALKRGTGSHNGSDAVVIGIQKQPDTNTLALTERLDTALTDMAATLPEGMVIARNIFRQATFIEHAVDNVLDALRDGALLVVLIVWIFLVSGRATAITVLAIPLSLMVAVISLSLMDATINTMTLGGMAIAIGALVDDAIIDVENVARRLRENAALTTPRPVLTVVFEASKEIRVSIVFATLIIVLVFLPLFFLTGVEGRLLRPLGFAYIVSLGASLLTALTITPVLCSIFLPRALAKGREPRLVGWLKRGYGELLDIALPRWKSISAVSLVLLLVALIGFAGMGRAFLPAFNEGTLTISVVTLPGTSLEQSNQLGRLVERLLLEEPEVVATARRTGRAERDEHAMGVNASEIDVGLVIADRDMETLLVAIREKLSIVPGTNIVIGQPISHRIDHMLSGTRANIAVKLFGDDLLTLRRLAEEARAIMAEIDGVVDLTVEQQTDIPIVRIDLDRHAIARYGASVLDVNHTIETAFLGTTVSRVLEGQRAHDLVVRLDSEASTRWEDLAGTMIQTPSGVRVPLSSLARVSKDISPNTISRENVRRKIVVSCNVAGRDLVGVVDEIRAGIAEDLTLPPGYHVAFGGQFARAVAASETLAILGGLVVVGIFLLLVAAFGSVRDAALVMVNLPLALIGGVVGVFLTGSIVSVASIIGFITLFGIATRNGILLVSHVRHLIAEEGETDIRAAIRRGAAERLAPILMTALTAALALIPLALKAGEPGGEIEAPMAIVILCGLVTSTLLNAFVVPALYLRFGGVSAQPGRSEMSGT